MNRLSEMPLPTLLDALAPPSPLSDPDNVMLLLAAVAVVLVVVAILLIRRSRKKRDGAAQTQDKKAPGKDGR
uniref:Uncharacterized protein n=1 Tax=uncultured bacterium contig00006 TaxID=1181498 RepID=A0A806JYE8_9BACT|nr:hypothetical protein [uncultured bacterium contig00006]